MRREALYLNDIIEACDAIREFLEGLDEVRFQASDMVRSAVVHKLTVIGEAAARLSQEFREQCPGIEWQGIVGFRNILVHEYFAVNWPIVWIAASEDVPDLRQKVASVIQTVFPELAQPPDEEDRGLLPI